MTCPDCEYQKSRAALWRHEAYRIGGTPLPWDVDKALQEAVLAEREECAKVCERMAARCNDIRAAALEMASENIRSRT